eukprot:TRINITY_DN7794_c0_g1_i4.p5 TRINITY_DN7794_c0_g1~~TRINITY_DN7794_c0_g1_i4.p5  ORF type:complete len:104 (+),score=41.82 TRINITY_DN7794_c0_g1_i4:119-430(+)
MLGFFFFFFFSSRRRHTRCREVSWARRCVQETERDSHCPYLLSSEPTAKGTGLSLIHISEPTRPLYISYAVFCLKKKKKKRTLTQSKDDRHRPKNGEITQEMK